MSADLHKQATVAHHRLGHGHGANKKWKVAASEKMSERVVGRPLQQARPAQTDTTGAPPRVHSVALRHTLEKPETTQPPKLRKNFIGGDAMVMGIIFLT